MYKRLTFKDKYNINRVYSEFSEKDTINRLAELEDKIENGTLKELPCKVYQFDNGGDIYESEIKGLIYDCGHIAFDESAIGKTIFLTKAEAEQKLREQDK